MSEVINVRSLFFGVVIKSMIDLKRKAKYSIHEYCRLIETLKFLPQVNEVVLDIGEKNKFSQKIKNIIDVDIDNTAGDLNFANWKPNKKYSTVFCFHVIEHLINPLLFLMELRKRCSSNAKIFLTYPTGHYWHTCHWHQIDTKRFKLLLEEAGYTIVRHQSKILWRDWKYMFFNLRPFLRLIFGQRYQYYELKCV